MTLLKNRPTRNRDSKIQNHHRASQDISFKILIMPKVDTKSAVETSLTVTAQAEIKKQTTALLIDNKGHAIKELVRINPNFYALRRVFTFEFGESVRKLYFQLPRRTIKVPEGLLLPGCSKGTHNSTDRFGRA